MCQYIKDNDEQCGMDSEPFCRHHEDSLQAELHAIGQAMFEAGDVPTGGQFAQLIAEAVESHESGVQSGSDFGMMNTTCSGCETPLRRTERLKKPDNRPNHVVFEAIVECECAEFVLGSTGVRKKYISDDWLGE